MKHNGPCNGIGKIEKNIIEYVLGGDQWDCINVLVGLMALKCMVTSGYTASLTSLTHYTNVRKLVWSPKHLYVLTTK